MSNLPPIRGLRHLALSVNNFAATLAFYKDLLGMQIEWQPDDDNVYLTSGMDNLALHRAKNALDFSAPQRLDHLGFILATPEDVDAWYDHFVSHNIKIAAKPRTHRDGARSFYCYDPDGNLVQMIYHPPLAENK